jgi:hypothetical protein
LSVRDAGNAPARLVNTASVSGGGEIDVPNDEISIVTPILPKHLLILSKLGHGIAGRPPVAPTAAATH